MTEKAKETSKAKPMNIYEKLVKIQAELKAPKNQFNKYGNYSYRSLEDILEAVKPLTLKYNCVLTITDRIFMIGDRYYVEAHARLKDCESEEYIDNIAYAMEGEPQGGMTKSQNTGSTSTYSRKYCLGGLFCLDDNKDADTNEFAEQTQAAKKQEALAKANIKKGKDLPIGVNEAEELMTLMKSITDKNGNTLNIDAYLEKQFNKKDVSELTFSEYQFAKAQLEKAKK